MFRPSPVPHAPRSCAQPRLPDRCLMAAANRKPSGSSTRSDQHSPLHSPGNVRVHLPACYPASSNIRLQKAHTHSTLAPANTVFGVGMGSATGLKSLNQGWQVRIMLRCRLARPANGASLCHRSGAMQRPPLATRQHRRARRCTSPSRAPSSINEQNAGTLESHRVAGITIHRGW